MISPSETVDAKTDGCGAAGRGSVRLLADEGRGVVRLQFHPLERTETVAGTLAGVETNGMEVFLKEKVAALDEQLRSQAEQMSIKMEIARTEAKAEARLEWDHELEDRIAGERVAMLKALAEFHRERARYFAGVEAEVVKLALAIAARVLHREAKLDPLLLAGVVRVALEKVAEDSATVLRVPVSAIVQWRQVFEKGTESSLQVVADERLDEGECVLDTNVGRVELGVGAQLEEIERGFFDLMHQRPA